MVIKNITLKILTVVFVLIFLRDFILTIDYFITNKTIPFYAIQIESSSIFVYFKDVAIVFWNIYWTSRVFNTKIFLYILIFIFILLFNLLLTISNFNLMNLLIDIRLLFTLYAIMGIFFILKRYPNIHYHRVISIIIFLIIINAFATLVQFSVIGFSFGFRSMGLFSVAAINAYILYIGFISLYVFMKYKYIKIKWFYLLSFLFFIAILATGTRIVIIGFVLTSFIMIYSYFIKLKNLNQNFKIAISSLSIIIGAIIFVGMIIFANNVADRGNILDQENGGRIGKLFDIINILEDRNKIYFGEGSGWGSNLSFNLISNLPSEYIYVDGTLNFLLVHSGLFGAFLVTIITFYLIFRYSNYKILIFAIIGLPILLIGLSVNIFEQTLVLMIGSLNIAFVYQQEKIRTLKWRN